jgi:Ca2+/H+ antiporter, TMEM165/GDT1 family
MIMLNWAHAGTPIVAAFLGSLVEFVEALTIVLAVGTVRGWRHAVLGAVGGAVLLALLVIALGPSLQAVPLGALQLAVGVLLLLFGMRWLRKAVLRAGGIIALHDEDEAFARETAALRADAGAGAEPRRGRRWDKVAIATTFKAVVLEGVEVVFIVIAAGAVGHTLVPASLGAGAALVLVILLGVALHRPLALVPENALKFAVGVMISSFGVFWVGEGVGFTWPKGDLSILAMIVAFLLASLASIPIVRRQAAARPGRAVVAVTHGEVEP